MPAYSFLSTEKIKGTGSFTRKMHHNFRLTAVPNADPNKVSLNHELITDFNNSIDTNGKPYVDYAKEFKNKISASQFYQNNKVRKDAVMGIEVMLTYNSHEAGEDFDLEKWKKVNVEWLQSTFGKENVISAMLHQDETANHIHAMVIPMVNDRLNCKHFLGGRAKMIQLQDSYGKAMEEANIDLKRGLRGSSAKHNDVKRMYDTINRAINYEAPTIDSSGLLKKENVSDYKKRADKQVQDLQLKHIYEKTKMQREIDEAKTHLKNAKKDIKKKEIELEENFGNIKAAASKIRIIEQLNEGFRTYPDREKAKQVYNEVQDIIEHQRNIEFNLEHDTNKEK